MARMPSIHPMKKAANLGSFIAHPVKLNLPMTLDFNCGLEWRQQESLPEKLANRSIRVGPL